jgi:hypothetical protein
MLCCGASANAGAANQPETMQFNSLQRVAAIEAQTDMPWAMTSTIYPGLVSTLTTLKHDRQVQTKTERCS